MAGIKRKSATTSTSETKATAKKVRVNKLATNSAPKRHVIPVVKPKPANEDNSESFNESDTSEQGNGFYGFSAAQNEEEDVEEVSDADISEDAVESSHNGKTLGRLAENERKEKEGNTNFDPSESKLAALNGSPPHLFSTSLAKRV